MAKNISLLGADYPDVPAVQLPQTGGGTATFYDIDVIDSLDSDSSTDALSAKQGKVLKEKIEDVTNGQVTWDDSNVTGDMTRNKWFCIGRLVIAGLEFTPLSGRIANGYAICTGLPEPLNGDNFITESGGRQMRLLSNGTLAWYFPTKTTNLDRADIQLAYIKKAE